MIAARMPLDGELVIDRRPKRTRFGAILRGVAGAAVLALAGVGSCPSPAGAAGRPASTSQDNITYHGNNMRLGWYQSETLLTTANVGSSAFHLIGTLATHGKSYSQPLYLSNQVVSDGSRHNLVIITDTTDAVYAYDADSLALVWSRSFTSATVRQQLSSDTGCDDVWPNDGIVGTPVADRGRNVMYVVVPTYDNGRFALRLHALSLASGADAHAPVLIDATAPLVSGGMAHVSPRYNFDRAGLLESSNTVYVPLSTHCDFDSDSAHGWLLAYNADTLAQSSALVDTTAKNIGSGPGGTRFLGSVWQGGFGIAADASNNVYFATGNGPANAHNDFSMSVLRLDAELDPASLTFFTPSTWQNESRGDEDLGSGGVMLLPDQTTGPDPHLAIIGGKTGEKYLLNRDALGGLHSVDQIPFETNTAGGIFGGPAYFVDSAGNQKILYGGTPSLNAYTLTTSPYGLVQTSATNVGGLEGRNSGVTPVVSSNGMTAGTAIAWAIKSPPGNVDGSGPIELFAFDATNLASLLYTAQAGAWTGNGNTGGALITPLVANGRVYLATDGMVSVFGVK